MKINYTWDGEKIKQTVLSEETKLTPMEITNAIANIRGQMNQMEGSKAQVEQQLKQANDSITNLKKSEKDLIPFEEKCIELQKDKLSLYIKQISEELEKQAFEDAKETISKDPNAYTEEGKKQLPYLNYQKALATNEKISKNISKEVISKYLYNEPVFENPFK